MSARPAVLGPNAQALYQVLIQLLPPKRRIGIEGQLPPFRYHFEREMRVGRFKPAHLISWKQLLKKRRWTSYSPALLLPINFRLDPYALTVAKPKCQTGLNGSPNRWIIEDDYDSQFKYSGRYPLC